MLFHFRLTKVINVMYGSDGLRKASSSQTVEVLPLQALCSALLMHSSILKHGYMILRSVLQPSSFVPQLAKVIYFIPKKIMKWI